MCEERQLKGFIKFRKLYKVFVFVLVTMLFVTSSFIAQKEVNVVKASGSIADKVSNPRRPANITTWDCVYFGSYWQAKNKHNAENHEGEYLKEPIKWRVLEKKDGELFLMADQSLESIQYNQEVNKTNPDTGELDLSWANSDLREWLNDDFYDDAFTSAEKEDINLTTVTADKSLQKPNLDQGPDTQDYVYILSMQEALNAKYGFANNYISTGAPAGTSDVSNTRCSVNTDYTKRTHSNKSNTLNFNDEHQSTVTGEQEPTIYKKILSQSYDNYDDCGIWWLRTIKSISTYPYYMYRVDYNGIIKEKPGPENNACVRPVIKVKQNSPHLRYAGTTNSIGQEVGCCGDDVSYEIEENTLRIFGNGPMYEFDEYTAPWYEHFDDIYTVIVEGNVSSVSENAFKDCANISYIYLNDSVTSISEDAFGGIEKNEELFISVAENSDAQSLCAQYGWNYTTVRSTKPLCIEIKEIKDTIQTADTFSFKFDNPCVGQSYEIYMDDELIETKTDLDETINCCITGIDAGVHKIKVNALVRGSNGIERRTAGNIVRINDQGFGEPVWVNRSQERVRWDTLYFGRYPQTEDPQGDYTRVDYNGVTHTYKTEPIKWRVLSHEGHELLLLADRTLDNRQFDSAGRNVWKNSSLRAWLNDDDANASDPGFIARAFNEDEQAELKETVTPTNTTGNETKDKVWLMSLDEAKKDEYGFISTTGYAKSRRANGTDLALMDSFRYNPNSSDKYLKYPWYKNCETDIKDGSIIDANDTYHDRATIWWFRDKNSSTCARADYPGNINEAKDPKGLNAMIRPMIKIDDRSTEITDAGTIDSYGDTSKPDEYYNVYIDGKLDKKVKEGSTYELPTDNTKRSTSTSIGYIDDDNPDSVYEKGTTFSINRDRNFSKLASVTAEPAGTAIRLVNGESHGLAFACKATVSAASNPSGNPIHSKAFEYGTLVTTYDDYVDVYDNEINVDTEEVAGHRIHNIKFGKQDFTSKPQMYIVGITRLQQQNYAREYVARPYVIIHFEGTSDKAVIYPDQETPLFVKSAKQVAENLMKSAKWKSGGYSAWQKEWITSYTILD